MRVVPRLGCPSLYVAFLGIIWLAGTACTKQDQVNSSNFTSPAATTATQLTTVIPPALKAPPIGDSAIAAVVKRHRIIPGRPIVFHDDSPDIDETSGAALDGVAAVILANPNINKLVVLVSDSTKYAKSLFQLGVSALRAASVVSWLRKAGVRPRIMRSRGFGDFCPTAAPSTPKEPCVEVVVLEISDLPTKETCGCPTATANGVTCPEQW